MAAKSYLNSAGVALAVTGSPVKWASAKAGAAYDGTLSNDAIYTGGGSTMAGGAGDDTYYVYYKSDVVKEKPNEGIDTVVSSTSTYTLPDNIENLIITAAKAIGIGNSGDNIIMGGGTGPQTLNGGAGNDVLIAGTGKDTFVFNKGEGSDVIVGFKDTDVVQLNGYSLLTNFAKVKAAMTQVGADTVIKLGGGEILTLRDHKIGDFKADNFSLPFDKQAWKLTFSEDFNSFSGSATGKNTTWMTTYPYSGIATRTLPSNKEAEYYSDSSVGVNPFSIHDGVLDITANRATPGVETPAGSGLTWTSGLITTYKSFSQLYGYFEVSAQLPAGKGFWPAFWLLPADNTWPPELDIFEVLGSDPSTLYATAHSKADGTHTMQSQAITVSDTSKGFHTYAVNWQSDYITWYVDGYAVAKSATPADMHKPMYMLLNLGVGAAGSWPGATDASTPQGHMLIDYVRAYTAKPPGTDTITNGGAPSLILAKIAAGIGAAAVAGLSGTAAAGALVEVYDGNTLIGTTNADLKSGAYSLTLSGLGAGTHTLTTKTEGSVNSTAITVVVGTAADIMKQMPDLQKMTNLGRIVLTDTNVLTVGSLGELKALLINGKAALSTIMSDYTFAVTNSSGNTTTFTAYDKAGTFLSSTASTVSGGQLSSKVIKLADGSSDTFAYKNGLVVSETSIHADGTKDIYLTHITGKTYIAEHSAYDASGTRTAMERTHQDGTYDTVMKIDAQTGVKTYDVFSTSGDLTSRTINKASGEMVQQAFSNKVLTSEYIIYAPGGDLATELKTFKAGVLVEDTIRNADQTRDTFTFNISGQNYVTKHQAFDAAGKVEVTDLTMKDGSHTVTASQAHQNFVTTKDVADVFKGLGGDTFVFDKPAGRDVIQNFHAGSGPNHDIIKIDSAIVADVAHLSISTVGADTVIQLGTPQDTIILKGIAAAALTHDNFWFV